MLVQCKIDDYITNYKPVWGFVVPDNCPPQDIDVPTDQYFYRLSRKKNSYNDKDFLTKAQKNPNNPWGDMIIYAVGLSLVLGLEEAKAEIKLPKFKGFQGIIELVLNPTDGVVKQTGGYDCHYTFWFTKEFSTDNLKMIEL